ncbi:hypothetical protein [Leptospira noguchii]|uniref:Uncharacterized protein n=1 Tax=Leptospira noguchii TaxID=28182 RepID=A0AAE9K6T5_9LEPT|nr:hypothetical protein [Leptospira noguchii]UOG55425.1 hypothetical protein MAL03_10905 [Leptospira noguchii]
MHRSPNSAKRFLRKRFRSLCRVELTQQNAFLNSMHRSPNSAKRFPELNASLPKGRSAGSR